MNENESSAELHATGSGARPGDSAAPSPDDITQQVPTEAPPTAPAPTAPAPAWAVPSPGGPVSGAPVPGTPPGGVLPDPAAPVPGSPPIAASPTIPAAEPGRPAVPLFRRPLLLTLGGVGAAVLLAGTGFVAGQHVRPSDSTSLVSSRGSSVPDGEGGGGFGPGDGDHGGGRRGFAGSGMTLGQIAAVRGSTLTLNGLGGGTLTVRTTASTTVTGVSSLSALKAGQVVLVAGTRATDGTITATSIAVRGTTSGGLPGGPGQDPGTGRDGQGSAGNAVAPGAGVAAGAGAVGDV